MSRIRPDCLRVVLMAKYLVSLSKRSGPYSTRYIPKIAPPQTMLAALKHRVVLPQLTDEEGEQREQNARIIRTRKVPTDAIRK